VLLLRFEKVVTGPKGETAVLKPLLKLISKNTSAISEMKYYDVSETEVKYLQDG
jgi:hypothetical protein